MYVNGRSVKAGSGAKAGDVVKMTLPDPEPIEAEAEDIPLKNPFEEREILSLTALFRDLF